MKELIYYQDVMMKEFEASILKQAIAEDGRKYIVLDNTAFYPTGGGQPHDTGYLNDVEVVDVEKVDGDIRHYVLSFLPEDTKTVHGKLDWERRFDHMQQHAGQHILTASFVELFNYQTVSFHLGQETVTIDLDTSELTEEELQAVEKRANDIILDNRQIETKWITEEELSKYPLRKAIQVTGEIRLVIIPEFDYNGCGGTHPITTGGVQAIKILSTEKQKNKTRVHFVCGMRVVHELGWRKKELSKAAKLANAPEKETAGAVQKLLDTQKSLEKKCTQAEKQLLSYEAKELAMETPTDSIIKKAFVNRSIQELQQLARSIVKLTPATTILFVSKDREQVQFVAAKGKDTDQVSMKDVSNAVFSVIDGNGGGNDTFVQGGGKTGLSPNELLSKMVEALNK
ncbi:alanyl-tRNA editing protein [Rummeliibacillus stabekisii]|uniref:alanyl-tRNA editing protein n=1 Tax=Rummeliibacillus stabekisii TaxID=241244 RepID=UPI00116F4321|nr:DHHA1 domain-containing protein [Rummeliibacillus stabekisii]MBB5171771.1 alanyl-tRNA synthetase [Rummeliibacillus stabekisii]GEL06480.1 alanyl-tRNA editing protein [Rummeliibacillus stabekisii]